MSHKSPFGSVTFCEDGQLKGWQPHFQRTVAKSSTHCNSMANVRKHLPIFRNKPWRPQLVTKPILLYMRHKMRNLGQRDGIFYMRHKSTSVRHICRTWEKAGSPTSNALLRKAQSRQLFIMVHWFAAVTCHK